MSTEQERAARHLMWCYDVEGGWQPGSFHEQLIRLLVKADTLNRMKLLSIFPEYQWAVNICLTQGAEALAEAVKERFSA